MIYRQYEMKMIKLLFATFTDYVRNIKNNYTGYWMIKHFPSIIIFLILSFIFLNSCSDTKSRKIKLAASGDVVKTSGPAGTSVLKVAPEEQKTLVIRHFKNHTRDASLDWLERGLTDMLTTEFSQSPYINIISESQFLDVARKMGKSDRELETRVDEIRVAHNAGAELLLTGHISYNNDLLRIEIEVTNAQTGADLKKERVEGKSLEKLFSMVDELSERLRQFLREKGEHEQFVSVKPSEMTTSLEAFRCYSKALENMEKYLYADAEDCLEEALRRDSTFAAAYFQLMGVKRALKKPVNLQEYLAKTKKYAERLSFADKVKLELIESELRGDPFKIFSTLEEAIKNSPLDLDLRFTLAQHYRMWGHEEKAMQEYEELLEMAPDHKMAYNDLGYLYADMGDFKTALYMLDKYEGLAPEEPNPHDSKGEILVYAGKFREAVEEYKKALDIMPGYYNSAFKLSEIYTELGDKNKALQYLDQGLKYVPDTEFERNAGLLRARIYWRFGEIEKADKYALELLDRHPLMSGILIRRIEMYRSAGKEDLAKKIELESFKKYKKSMKSRNGFSDYAKSFLEFFTYSDIPIEEVIPVLGEIIQHSESNVDDLNMGLLTALYDIFIGETEKGKALFEEKMPYLLEGLKLRKKDVGWGSTWKNLFRFFDEKTAGHELSKIFADRLSALAAEEGRKDLEFISNMAQARVLGRDRQEVKYHYLYTKYGVPEENKWKVCGPFRDYKYSGFDYAYPPESDLNIASEYKYNNREIRWIDGQDERIDGYVNLIDLFNETSFVTAYSLIYIESPDERKVQIRLGSDESCKFWLNDNLIWQHYIKRSAVVDRDIVTVVLHPGYNKIMLKITNTDLDWGFYFRVTDEEGNGFSDLKFVSPDNLESSLVSVISSN